MIFIPVFYFDRAAEKTNFKKLMKKDRIMAVFLISSNLIRDTGYIYIYIFDNCHCVWGCRFLHFGAVYHSNVS